MNLKQLITVVTFTTVFSSFIFGQEKETPQVRAQEIKGREILKKAEALISGPAAKDLETLSFQFDTIRIVNQRDGKKRQIDGEIKLHLEALIKIRLEIFSDFTSNQHLSTRMLNSPRYSQNSDVFVNGKPFKFGSNLSGIAPEFSKQERISHLKETAFRIAYPLVLNPKFLEGRDVRYVGKAESNDGKAEVVEITNGDKARYRLFFDDDSHLPVLMIVNFYEPVSKKKITRKYFYSDYRKLDDVFIAHKIIIEFDNGAFEERVLRKSVFNSPIKPKLFEVKEDKINPYSN